MKRFARYYLPAIIWALIIFVLSSIPTLPTEPLGFLFSDKIAHFGVYFVFGLLLANAFTRGMPQRQLTSRLFFAALVGIIYACSDELHQSLVPGRYPSICDAVADSVGVATAQVIYVHRARFTKLLTWLPKTTGKPVKRGNVLEQAEHDRDSRMSIRCK